MIANAVPACRWAAGQAGGIADAGAALTHVHGLRMLLDLLLLAACGGVFSVPLYAIIQDIAAPSQRSRMVAANNIMNALFMVAGAAAAAGLAAVGLRAPAVLHFAAVANPRWFVEDPELAWRQATHAIVGFSLAVCDKNVLPGKIDEAVVNLLGMVGVDRAEAWEVAKRRCPELPGE